MIANKVHGKRSPLGQALPARWRLGKEAGQTKQIRRKSVLRMQGDCQECPDEDQAR
ncbi:hypothetical protein HanXRQr2_Chr14g0655291 [Helianthus annuus]|uniref:Uncharacterized protein n=1 Tax=Helianthus annuus TaxID=4232 RepID=A0A251SN65_HELAN|nr:hypothetical protein HanXRQr2_Chr14g0655291 [Helianthus annuus]